jgi:hypothetical protein
MQRLAGNAMKRIQANEKGATQGGTAMDRIKLMVGLATQLNGSCQEGMFVTLILKYHI